MRFDGASPRRRTRHSTRNPGFEVARTARTMAGSRRQEDARALRDSRLRHRARPHRLVHGSVKRIPHHRRSIAHEIVPRALPRGRAPPRAPAVPRGVSAYGPRKNGSKTRPIASAARRAVIGHFHHGFSLHDRCPDPRSFPTACAPAFSTG